MSASFFFQNFNLRSPVQIYLPVSSETVTIDKETRKQGKVVLAVSNYHFNRGAQAVRQNLKCTSKDCKVSIKFSSEAFKSSKVERQEYYFDKGGLQVNYPAFLHLLTDDFSETLWRGIERYYKEKTGIDLKASVQSYAQPLLPLLTAPPPPPPPPPPSRPQSPASDESPAKRKKEEKAHGQRVSKGLKRSTRKNKGNLLLDGDDEEDDEPEEEERAEEERRN